MTKQNGIIRAVGHVLDIRVYKRFKDDEFHRWAVVTILYGPDLPNKWNMEISQ